MNEAEHTESNRTFRIDKNKHYTLWRRVFRSCVRFSMTTCTTQWDSNVAHRWACTDLKYFVWLKPYSSILRHESCLFRGKLYVWWCNCSTNSKAVIHHTRLVAYILRESFIGSVSFTLSAGPCDIQARLFAYKVSFLHSVRCQLIFKIKNRHHIYCSNKRCVLT